MVASDPQTVLLDSAARLAVDPGCDVSQQLCRAEEMTARVPSRREYLQAIIAFCRMVADHHRGRIESGLLHAREAHRYLFVPGFPYQLGEEGRAALLLPYLGTFQWWNGRADQARRTVLRGRAAAERDGNKFAELHGRLVALTMDLGVRGPDEEDTSRRLLREVEARGWSRRQPLSAVYLAEGWRAWWSHQLSDARAMLGVFRSIVAHPGHGQLLESGLLESELLLAEGDAAEARAALTALRHRLGAWDPPRVYRSRLLSTDCRIALRMGLVEDARARLCASGITPASSVRVAVVTARAHTLGNAPDKALDALRHHVRRLPDGGVQRALQADVFVEAAHAHHARHCRSAALDAVRQALLVAAPFTYRRPFIDNGAWLSPLLRTLRPEYEHGTRISFVDGVLDAAARPCPPHPSPTDFADRPGAGAITPREAEVLAALPSHLTLKDIATIQYVSANSIKSHVKSLYRKLGVHNRREAVEEARRTGLLD